MSYTVRKDIDRLRTIYTRSFPLLESKVKLYSHTWIFLPSSSLASLDQVKFSPITIGSNNTIRSDGIRKFKNCQGNAMDERIWERVI